MKACQSAPKQFSVAEAAVRLELCPDSVYDMVKKRQIRSRRKGPNNGRIFFLQCDLDDYLEGKTNRRTRKK